MKFLAPLLLFGSLFFMTGCPFIHEGRWTGNYYHDCVEYYDAGGVYHKDCKEGNNRSGSGSGGSEGIGECLNCN